MKLQSLGVTFGDPLVPRWVIVDDEYARSPAVQLDGTSVVLLP